MTSGVWNYEAYGNGVLQRAADAAALQSKNLAPVKCKVRIESANRTHVLTEEEANKYNRTVHGYCQGLSKFIKKILMKGELKTNDSRIQRHELGLHLMLHKYGRQATEVAWKAKLSKMFIEQCIDGQDRAKDDGLKEILHFISITNPIHPKRKEKISLSGSQAYQQQLSISHTHHLQGGGRGAHQIYDCNPNNFHLENHATNMSKKSCSRFFWFSKCQCDKRCHHRCGLLDVKRFEHEVRTQLVMCAGFWPGSDEVAVRTNIRTKFIEHHENNGQSPPPYLSEDNREQLLAPMNPLFEGLRHRFDMNTDGHGVLCPRQKRKITFKDILTGQRDIPKGMIEFLDKKLRALKPVKVKVAVTHDDANADRSVPGYAMSQDGADEENLFQLQRILAMSYTLKMMASGEFIKDHPQMAMEEQAVNAVLWNGRLDSTGVQIIHFYLGNEKGIRNDYLETECKKTSFHVGLPRLLKTLQIYLDHHDDWMRMSTVDVGEQDENEWLEETSTSGNGKGRGDGNVFADPQMYLEYTSIRSPKNGLPLIPQLAAAQVLESSHTTHPGTIRYTNPIKVQMGGPPRDANPANLKQEMRDNNIHRSICSYKPAIPCMSACNCHPTHPCKATLYKLDEKYVNDTVVVHSQLGPHGRYPDANGDISKIHQEVLKEVKLAYEYQNEEVPKFVGVQEVYGAFPIYKCDDCDKRYFTMEAGRYCCKEQQQVSNQDDRVKLTAKQINNNQDHQEEVLNLIKEWGLRSVLIMKKTSFKFKNEDNGLQALINKETSHFVRYCGENNVQFDILKKCTGKRFGCTCQLHDDNDEEEEEETETD